MAFNNEDILILAKAGFNAQQIAALNMVGAAPAPAAPTAPVAPVAPTPAAPVAQDPTTKLLEMKKLLDAGAISQEEYDKVKAQILGF